MLKSVVFTTFMALTTVAQAQNAPVYYKGTESLPLAGAADCYVEAIYSVDLLTVQLRALVPHPHEAGNPMEALGPVEAAYNAAGYYRFQSTEPTPEVKEVLLNASAPGTATKYGALLLHGSHHDPLFCENLVALEGDAQQEAVDVFAGFAVDEDHDHEHDEDHDHEHEDEHDHDHEHAL